MQLDSNRSGSIIYMHNNLEKHRESLDSFIQRIIFIKYSKTEHSVEGALFLGTQLELRIVFAIHLREIHSGFAPKNMKSLLK